MQITDNAINKVAEMKSPNENLRVYISGGGCSGFNYGFKLDEKTIDGDFSIYNWIEDLRIYIKVKAFVSLVTGILFGSLCYLFGVDFALFFGFLAFVLNFIPQVGSLIATVFPVLLAFLEMNSLPMVGLFAALLIAVQLIMGTFVEVRYIGKSFAMSTMVVFVNLVFWGYLWGIAGVVLSVPIIILFKNIANHIDESSMLARLFSSEK